MPRGMSGVRGAVQDIQARKEGGGDFPNLTFRIDDGESAVVRFLEQGDDVKWAWCHEVPVEGRNYGRNVACRDQDEDGNKIGEACPGCEQGLKRKFQGWVNVIWRDAPIFETEKVKLQNGNEFDKIKKDASGRFIRTGQTADQVAAWQSGIVVFEELDGKDVVYKGLGSRDFRVTRRGTGMSTRYSIEPADPDAGPQPLSEADKKLAAEKNDFTKDATPQSYESWGRSQAKQEGAHTVPADTSPFMRRNA